MAFVIPQRLKTVNSLLTIEATNHAKACPKSENHLQMKGRHKSLDKHLKNNILWAEHIPGVQKVVLGISEACRHKYPPGHIRFKMDVEGGIKINGYSGKGITDIFIKIDPITKREAIKAMIAKRFKASDF